jgi:hypothetical protein
LGAVGKNPALVVKRLRKSFQPSPMSVDGEIYTYPVGNKLRYVCLRPTIYPKGFPKREWLIKQKIKSFLTAGKGLSQQLILKLRKSLMNCQRIWVRVLGTGSILES